MYNVKIKFAQIDAEKDKQTFVTENYLIYEPTWGAAEARAFKEFGNLSEMRILAITPILFNEIFELLYDTENLIAAAEIPNTSLTSVTKRVNAVWIRAWQNDYDVLLENNNSNCYQIQVEVEHIDGAKIKLKHFVFAETNNEACAAILDYSKRDDYQAQILSSKKVKIFGVLSTPDSHATADN